MLLLIAHLTLNYYSKSYVQISNPNSDWTYLEKLEVEELYIGNSRTRFHVNIENILEQTNVESYALSHDGGDIRILFLKLKKYLSKPKALKRINLQFDPFILYERSDLYGLEKYAPELFFNKSMNFALKDKEGYTKYYFIFPLISYSPKQIFKIILRYHENTVPSGYYCKDKIWDSNTTFTKVEYPQKITYEIPVYLDSIFSLCKERNIELNALIPPVSVGYHKHLKTQWYEKSYKRLKSKYQVRGQFYDFSKLINDKIYFYNHSHLNCKGSIVYTEELIKYLYESTTISDDGFDLLPKN